MKTQKKSWLYKGTAIATVLTLIGIWSHLAAAFSTYEVREQGASAEEWSMAGMIIASSISLFLILTAIGITVLEKRADELPKGSNKKIIIGKIKSLNWFLGFFAFIEMYGNIYYSCSAVLKNPMFKFEDLKTIDTVAGVSIFMFSFTLTLISIVGSKLLSIFAVNEAEQPKKEKIELTEEEKKVLVEKIKDVAEIQKLPTYEPVPEQPAAPKQEATIVTPPALSTRNRS